MKKPRLIVGLGNPGKAYERTRHNIGFDVVKALAEKYQLTFRSSWRAKGKLAKGMIGDVETILLMPKTYMNRSGIAVKACVKRFSLDVSSLLVVSDEIALPFGKIRIREKGSSGGHKGLKNIEHELGGTQDYARLRVGISNAEEGELVEYVLSRFNSEEEQRLPSIISDATKAIMCWLEEGINAAMQKVNTAKS